MYLKIISSSKICRLSSVDFYLKTTRLEAKLRWGTKWCSGLHLAHGPWVFFHRHSQIPKQKVMCPVRTHSDPTCVTVYDRDKGLEPQVLSVQCIYGVSVLNSLLFLLFLSSSWLPDCQSRLACSSSTHQLCSRCHSVFTRVFLQPLWSRTI